MTGAEVATQPPFEPPGPGSWTLDPVHFPRVVTRYFAETQPEPFERGTAHFARFYGLLMDGMRTSYVNGLCYNQIQPVADEEVPQRFARASEVMRNRLWREQLREWEEDRKPTSIAAHRAIQSVDPDTLSDEDLASHLHRCRDHHSEMAFQHMRFTASAVIPTGDFVLHAVEWTGRPPSELLALTRGSAPVSAGGSDELERLVTSLRQDPSALALLDSEDDAATVLSNLRAMQGDAGPAVAGYLDLVGFRPLDGFDISEPGALELPDALLRAIRGAVSAEGAGNDDLEDKIADVRRSVPEAHRDEFDELLQEARLTYHLRDERGVYSDIWASGLMRRAALSAGRRLVRKGRIHSAEHMVDAGLDEMTSLILTSEGPSGDELVARSDYRATHSAKGAPPFLGPPPPHPPDPSGLPPEMARLMRALGFAMGSVFGSSEAEHEEQLLKGLAASQGVYEGSARRVSGPAQFDRINQGDVLVTEATSEAFNILLPLLGAIVTDNGGLLSHSAIVAREYGIPGVVGTRDATERIADGMRVRVDGGAGEVTLLS
jgi:phosphohistidine swiveling domain-containing protein